ncbi:hypothetical protein [Flaviaesturariibacter aridisoli]|uniref:Uncharacterized protein n=1 Tax=Flaviaesturariibacter aridisoli TaxID=2545761 RepID=A0A4R4E3J0_9BACT|nr:hypothetical protein [Flaviaesturariibacter aridisoli]TCZ74086.1 hypothetical protein E0486_03150 [Flaviaesturariibacter aridisoli]
MKKSILALAALLGTGAMGWAQNTTNTTSSGTNTQQTNAPSTVNTPGTPTAPDPQENPSGTNTSVNGNAPTTNNMTGTTPSTGLPATSSPVVNPGNSNTTGTLQSSTTTGVDGMQNTQGSMQSNSNYPAYGAATAVPGNFSTSLQRDYPTAFNPTWQQSGDWYRASFNNQNRNVMVYYAPNGNSYSVALPVLNGYIPEEVVTRALNTYGSNLYSISRVKAANGQDAYQINTLDGGMARNEFIGEDGSSFAAIDVFRHDDENMANGELMDNSNNAAKADSATMTTPATGDNTSGMGTNSSMSTGTGTDINNTSTDNGTTTEAVNSTNSADPKYKHKIKTEDGKKLKIKTKKGETKVKGDAMDASGGQ